MKIKQITLKKFRAAEDLTFDLDETLTVIAGVNGSGKSTENKGMTKLKIAKDAINEK